ncbi:MAG: hypothetical protein V2J12_13685 [Gammaproteobacteria bacterium]|jgi:hypothetical protein|nr:hypothetical protein [Gammaproteobacteria bacterium]
MTKAVIAAIIVYLLADPLSDAVLEPFGLGYLHAFTAMLAGMLIGGYLAPRSFIGPALLITLVFSVLTYVLIARGRGQPVLELIAEQHLMVSLGSFAGAALGAWLGMQAQRRWRPRPATADGAGAGE